MNHISSIIKGVASTCKFGMNKILNSDSSSSENFVTREEYEMLKNLILDIKTDIEKMKNDRNGKND
jgi:hypothetical protein